MDPAGLLVVYTEGDRVRGLGHVSRCSAYADEWRRCGGHVHWVLDGDETAVGMIGPQQTVEIMRWQDAAPEALIDRAGEVTLVDSYSATAGTLDAIAAMAGIKVYMDDLWRDWPAGLVVHPAPDPRPDNATALYPRTVWLEGPGWHPLRAPFWDVGPRAPVRADIERVLVVFGGGDLRSIGTRMAGLARTVCPGAMIDLVLGAGQGKPAPSAELTIHQAIDAGGMARLMLEADVAISGAGQTVFELARCGTPTVMVGIADNQRANREHWPELCGFVDAGPWDADDLDARVRIGLESLLAPAGRQAVMERAPNVVDGQGVRRLFDRLGQPHAQRID
jgi:spore coat polysaccharide biosynthesis predicted glycosyltransferase SpsG